MDNIKLTDLHPNDWNPNAMTDAEFTELVAELAHLAKPAKPIILRPNEQGYEIVDGEHTYRALLELGHDDLQPGWYEVAELDDFEAMRQTYKRNQHGTHNPVKQGLLFQRMMDERELSQRALADEIDVSEGTIRNSLEYAKAAGVRNDYAFDDLTVKQVRAYNRLPQAVGDLWLDCGANLRLLYVRPERLKETKLMSFDEAMNSDEYYYSDDIIAHVDAKLHQLGPLLELLPLLCFQKTPEGFRAAVDRLMEMDSARFGLWLSGRRGIERDTALPYLRPLAMTRWENKEPKVYSKITRDALMGIFRVYEGQYRPVVPADAFEHWITNESDRWSDSGEMAIGLEVLVGKFAPELRKQDVRHELMALDLEDAPENIKALTELDVPTRYKLWQAAYRLSQQHDLVSEIMQEAIVDAGKALIEDQAARKEADRLLADASSEAWIDILTQSSKLTPYNALVNTYNQLLREKQRADLDELFGDRKRMIETIVKDAKRIHLLREGNINGQKALEVLTARLAMLDDAELKMVCHFVVNPRGYGDPYTSWFHELRGKENG